MAAWSSWSTSARRTRSTWVADVMLVELGDQRRRRRRIEAQRLSDGLLAEHLADGRVGLGVAAPGLTEQRLGADLVAEHARQPWPDPA